LFPFLIKPLGKFGIRLFPSEITNFFIKAVNDAVDLRKSSTADGVSQDFTDYLFPSFDSKPAYYYYYWCHVMASYYRDIQTVAWKFFVTSLCTPNAETTYGSTRSTAIAVKPRSLANSVKEGRLDAEN
jgi:hypothetical protein